MNPAHAQPEPKRSRLAILVEAALVAMFGIAIALLANAVSPRGLVVGRDYFPEGTAPPVTTRRTNTQAVAPATEESPSSAADPLTARLAARGLALATLEQVQTLLRDPRFSQGRVVFIDARNDEHYLAGHIPGAYQFDHYRAEHYLPNVLPVALAAEQLVVYCGGGDCEDSEHAALTLGSLGVPISKLFIYGGGMKEWTASALPEETGARNSGKLKTGTP